ncbi:MAG: rubredoxin [Candidatus Methanomethylophilaceae archaeon]
MAVYRCKVCGYIYDDDKEFVPFAELDDSYLCTVCGMPKSEFEEIKIAKK